MFHIKARLLRRNSTQLDVELSSVELRRYKRAFIQTSSFIPSDGSVAVAVTAAAAADVEEDEDDASGCIQ